ncbi:uncharacterized protein OCT59_023265 [Rhizophagus irregularis]|uniref:SWIM-type domain-containing protein n=1 Tax=Rhizophagus irregularis (strain DAOM 181602 / DAOM 197198 / MUCL 43194) TaxID=747089 RepID=A0A2P4QPP0_RHIID|nr:hypothetical protein GLOIN_2v1869568 [Rhizophagus irregularis DAOM 181602=DAOM 197198]POG79627.1 hypothetical protein GLOIN_2v1869568 [Rhizophagus irregularis DAOM 181602=DAOM 197198]UZO29810.1 hypothetical protein OCT59_023265 [Rhizophagus irregularis]GBC34874.2 kinase-like domain-containing protein [Rhizophagus irregularis DAOM 181602=DAOM 197198]|eukprot:XP_025186493.1 hypothetical protein GLOIN_2v1869568 [Rhizophagus irregularis DAOM 181602=DAOM 197198]
MAGIESTARVEGYNWIIKQQLKANSTLYRNISMFANIIELNNEELNCKQAMIEEIGQEEVLEIWKVVDIRSERKNHVHFIIIINAISYLCSCLKSISKGIICRHYFRVMMNSKIAAFHISMIPQKWYKDIYQDKTNLQEKAVHKRNLYGRVWGLARTATLLAVEQEDDEITLILQDYIRRKSNRNTPKRLSTIINERSTIDEVSDNP